jgi:hypothetical protein
MNLSVVMPVYTTERPVFKPGKPAVDSLSLNHFAIHDFVKKQPQMERRQNHFGTWQERRVTESVH